MRLPARLLLLVGLTGFCTLSVFNLGDRAALGMKISPYKGSRTRFAIPGARSLFGRWDSISRVDVVADAGTPQHAGLSYVYPGVPPAQYGPLARRRIDAAALPGRARSVLSGGLHAKAVAYQLRSGATALVLEPGGGLGILSGAGKRRTHGCGSGGNPLLRRAVAATNPVDPYALPVFVWSWRAAGGIYVEALKTSTSSRFR